MLLMPRSSRLSPVLGFALFLFASSARPCFVSTVAVEVPKSERVLPANLVRFRISDRSLVPGVSLWTAKGVRVPMHVEGELLVPNTPPKPGRYRLRNRWMFWPYASSKQFGLETHAFEVGPPRQLELREPRLSLVAKGVRYPEDAQKRVGLVQLRYRTPLVNGDADHLIAHTLTLDGRELPFNAEVWEAGIPAFEIQTDCNTIGRRRSGQMRGGYTMYPQGTHLVTAMTSVMGEKTQPQIASLQINLECPPDEAPAKAVSPSAAPASERRSLPSSRCSSRHPVQGGGLTAALLATALFWGVRVRRRRGSADARTSARAK